MTVIELFEAIVDKVTFEEDAEDFPTIHRIQFPVTLQLDVFSREDAIEALESLFGDRTWRELEGDQDAADLPLPAACIWLSVESTDAKIVDRL